MQKEGGGPGGARNEYKVRGGVSIMSPNFFGQIFGSLDAITMYFLNSRFTKAWNSHVFICEEMRLNLTNPLIVQVK